jgi:hypothetical protein
MRALGMFTAGVVTALGIVAALVTFKSLPDIRRYIKMRSM